MNDGDPGVSTMSIETANRGVGGRFVRGHKTNSGKKNALKPESRCPAHFDQIGLKHVWRDLCKQSRNGNPTAAKQLIDLAERYAPRVNPADDDERYVQVSADAAASLKALDLGIGEIIHRDAKGLPLSDDERRILDTAKCFKQK